MFNETEAYWMCSDYVFNKLTLFTPVETVIFVREAENIFTEIFKELKGHFIAVHNDLLTSCAKLEDLVSIANKSQPMLEFINRSEKAEEAFRNMCTFLVTVLWRNRGGDRGADAMELYDKIVNFDWHENICYNDHQVTSLLNMIDQPTNKKMMRSTGTYEWLERFKKYYKQARASLPKDIPFDPAELGYFKSQIDRFTFLLYKPKFLIKDDDIVKKVQAKYDRLEKQYMQKREARVQKWVLEELDEFNITDPAHTPQPPSPEIKKMMNDVTYKMLTKIYWLEPNETNEMFIMAERDIRTMAQDACEMAQVCFQEAQSDFFIAKLIGDFFRFSKEINRLLRHEPKDSYLFLLMDMDEHRDASLRKIFLNLMEFLDEQELYEQKQIKPAKYLRKVIDRRKEMVSKYGFFHDREQRLKLINDLEKEPTQLALQRFGYDKQEYLEFRYLDQDFTNALRGQTLEAGRIDVMEIKAMKLGLTDRLYTAVQYIRKLLMEDRCSAYRHEKMCYQKLDTYFKDLFLRIYRDSQKRDERWRKEMREIGFYERQKEDRRRREKSIEDLWDV